MAWACAKIGMCKNIKKDIKITRDYVHIKTSYPKIYWESYTTGKLRSIYNTVYCQGGFNQIDCSSYKKRVVRIITCSKYNGNTEPLSKMLNLLKTEDTIKRKALKLYHRYKWNELPKYLDSMFTESNDNHSHGTRHKSLLYQLPTKTSTGRLCIRQYIVELSNTWMCH